ncbi:hypothetical protein CBS101457_000266 [Exobasidium rhododendri]|nr:hypothetical protein CBS101457_000266 [Exobasidium rhododendri]
MYDAYYASSLGAGSSSASLPHFDSSFDQMGLEEYHPDYSTSGSHSGHPQHPLLDDEQHTQHTMPTDGEQEHAQHSTSTQVNLISSETGYIPHTGVFDNMSVPDQMKVLEMISKYRGLRFVYIKTILRRRLTDEQKDDLLSDDLSRIFATLAALFVTKNTTLFPVWMDGMSDTEAETLVQSLMRVSGQKKDIVRNCLLTRKISTEQARSLLEVDDATLHNFALETGLALGRNRLHDDGSFRGYRQRVPQYPWQYNLNVQERSEVQNIVQRACNCKDTWARKLLKDAHVPKGFGMAILRCHGQRLHALIGFLHKKVPLPDDLVQYLEHLATIQVDVARGQQDPEED